MNCLNVYGPTVVNENASVYLKWLECNVLKKKKVLHNFPMFAGEIATIEAYALIPVVVIRGTKMIKLQ